jgi:hypothetical protein
MTNSAPSGGLNVPSAFCVYRVRGCQQEGPISLDMVHPIWFLSSNSASPFVQYVNLTVTLERSGATGAANHSGSLESGASSKYDSAHPRNGLQAASASIGRKNRRRNTQLFPGSGSRCLTKRRRAENSPYAAQLRPDVKISRWRPAADPVTGIGQRRACTNPGRQWCLPRSNPVSASTRNAPRDAIGWDCVGPTSIRRRRARRAAAHA